MVQDMAAADQAKRRPLLLQCCFESRRFSYTSGDGCDRRGRFDHEITPWESGVLEWWRNANRSMNFVYSESAAAVKRSKLFSVYSLVSGVAGSCLSGSLKIIPSP